MNCESGLSFSSSTMVSAASSPTKAISAKENMNPSPAECRRSSKMYAAITITNQMASQFRKRKSGDTRSRGMAGFCLANARGLVLRRSSTMKKTSRTSHSTETTMYSKMNTGCDQCPKPAAMKATA